MRETRETKGAQFTQTNPQMRDVGLREPTAGVMLADGPRGQKSPPSFTGLFNQL